jgi:hypothetical protein
MDPVDGSQEGMLAFISVPDQARIISRPLPPQFDGKNSSFRCEQTNVVHGVCPRRPFTADLPDVALSAISGLIAALCQMDPLDASENGMLSFTSVLSMIRDTAKNLHQWLHDYPLSFGIPLFIPRHPIHPTR